jgi:hypothetical protein
MTGFFAMRKEIFSKTFLANLLEAVVAFDSLTASSELYPQPGRA